MVTADDVEDGEETEVIDMGKKLVTSRKLVGNKSGKRVSSGGGGSAKVEPTRPTWRVNHDTQRIEVIYPSKPDYDERSRIKGKGFRWSPTRGAWVRKINPNSMYKAQSLGFNRTADVGIPISGIEKAEREMVRMEKSVIKHEIRSATAKAESEALHQEARAMAGVIPFGQPIHGESDRRYRERIHRKQGKFLEKSAEAKHEKQVSESVKRKAEYMKTNPAYAEKKVESLDKEIRGLDRSLDREYDPIYSPTREGFDEWQDTLRARKKEATEEREYWAKHLKSLGGVKYSRENIKKGDSVLLRGRWYKVARVSAKSVSVVWTLGGWTGTKTFPYRQIRDVKGPEEE